MIICNTRTASAPLTGVQRYLKELSSRIDGLQMVRPACYAQGTAGHIWEQAILPLKVGKNLLWSPGNTGPLAVKRQVLTVHDLATYECPDGFSSGFREFYNWLYPHLLPRVAAIITVSDFTRGRILERFSLPAEKVHTVYLGVDHSFFYPRDEREVEPLRTTLSLPKRYVLFLSAFSARKNVAGLMHAWQKAQAQVPGDIELVLAGGKGLGHVFSGGGLEQVPPRTRILGHIENGQLPALLSGAMLFAFPSLYEGFGLPPLEAMACGTPCLVSNTTALKEIADGAAFEVDPLNIDEMAQGLITLLNTTSLLDKFSKLGQTRAQAFSWEKTAQQTAAILERY